MLQSENRKPKAFGSDDVYEYCKPFHAFYRPDDENVRIDGWTVSILKKDGTWDLVYKMLNPYPILDLNMSELEFHFPDSIYARSCDGYLRGRVTRSEEKANSYGPPQRTYTSHFIVLDYLPQTIEMGVSNLNLNSEPLAVSNLLANNSHEVKIGIKNIEGLTKVVIERKKENQRVPSRFEVTDFKNGYFIATVENDIRTTFTAIGYNDNGTSKSLPLTIEPLTTTTLNNNVSLVGENLILPIDLDNENFIHYEITTLNMYSNQVLLDGWIYGDNQISVSSLPAGIYVLTYTMTDGKKQSIKFKK